MSSPDRNASFFPPPEEPMTLPDRLFEASFQLRHRGQSMLADLLDEAASILANMTDEKLPMTRIQREILDYLNTYNDENGYAPSFEEIASRFNYSSLATVHEHLSNLERKGYITKRHNEARAITILP